MKKTKFELGNIEYVTTWKNIDKKQAEKPLWLQRRELVKYYKKVYGWDLHTALEAAKKIVG